MKKILVTGFTPFGGEWVNPSYEAVKNLPNVISECEVVKREIPTVYHKAGNTLLKLIEEEKPQYVLLVGQAGGRNGITPEKLAVNVRSATIPDNEGNMANDEKIKEDGDLAYYSTFNPAKIVEKLKENEIPAHISYTAGTFVCNELLYTFLYTNKKENLNLKGGFVHVPYCETQMANKPKDTPYLPLITITKALEIVIKTMIEE